MKSRLFTFNLFSNTTVKMVFIFALDINWISLISLYTDEENISVATSAKSFLSLSPIQQNENPRDRLTRVKDQESREYEK